MERNNMNCDNAQELLSAFLDNEVSGYIGQALSHLYGCENCQAFFVSAARVRSLAKEDALPFPQGIDERVPSAAARKRKSSLLRYRFRLPAYAVSAAAVMLMVLSFMFGYLEQKESYEKELKMLMQAPPSHVVYGMNAVTVYPVMNHEREGDKK